MRKFVFLIHPRLSAREDMGRVNPIFKFIPEPILRSIIKHLPPIASSRIVIGGNEQVEGMIIVVPLVGSQFYSLPRDFVIEKIKSAVKMARDLDASVVGLGEFTSSVSHGGLDLEREAGITITNGNSLTAGVTVASVEKIIIEKKFTPENLKIGVVGAAGSIGSAVSRMLADQ
ncbi:MAG: hypothetical protein MUD10_04375 [Candidatus Pacebacteria bacterium]|nr:hypothetical protein [Candidatus Paceibacterota bacterium]